MLSDSPFADAALLDELVQKAQRGRAQNSAQVGDIHLARLGRYVICFRLSPACADYNFYADVPHADAAFSEQVEQLRAGILPLLFVPTQS